MLNVIRDNSAADRPRFGLTVGGIASVGLHVLLLALTMITMRGCENSQPSDRGGGDYQTIGIALEPDHADPISDENADQSDDQQPPAETDTRQVTAVPSDVVPTELPPLDDLLPSDIATEPAAAEPTRSLPETIGAGDSVRQTTPRSAVSGSPLLSGTAGQGPAGVPGPGETLFAGIVSKGSRFAYVIDISGSMGDDNRLRLAQTELKASLRLLRPNQQFAVIFYNDFARALKFSGRPAAPMYAANVVNIDLAERLIDLEQPDGSTRHLPALLTALSLQPDVVYYLTDGRQPELSPAELRQVFRSNRSRAAVNVVEFGSGPQDSRDQSWLQDLAGRTGGKYVYVPVR